MTAAPLTLHSEADALVAGRPRALLMVALGHLREAEASAAGDDADVEVALQLAWAGHYNAAAVVAAIQGLGQSLQQGL